MKYTNRLRLDTNSLSVSYRALLAQILKSNEHRFDTLFTTNRTTFGFVNDV